MNDNWYFRVIHGGVDSNNPLAYRLFRRTPKKRLRVFYPQFSRLFKRNGVYIMPRLSARFQLRRRTLYQQQHRLLKIHKKPWGKFLTQLIFEGHYLPDRWKD
jgi:hypothetical protein